MPKIAGSGSINQRHGSADPDPDPDPHQNIMDPQHWFKEWGTVFWLKVGFKGWARRREPSERIGHRKEDPIYFFPEMKLRGLSPNFHIHVSVSVFSFPTIGPPMLPCIVVRKGKDNGWYKTVIRMVKR